MNKKETTLAVNLLDVCIDAAASPETMLALNALRRTLMELWRRGGCQDVDAQALLRELEPLPALCGETPLPPTLPERLGQVMFLLCAPRMEAGGESAAQCRQQAWKIRQFRQWAKEHAETLITDDEGAGRETLDFLSGRLAMLEEAFAHLLALYKGRIAQAASQRRCQRQREIRRHWEAIPLAEASEAAAVSRARLNQAKEKLSEFAAEISAAQVLIPVTEGFQTPAEPAREPSGRETEEET